MTYLKSLIIFVLTNIGKMIMAKKYVKHTVQKSTGLKNKLSVQVVVIVVLAIAIIGFFIVNNFITNEPKVEYYTFTKEGELTFTDSLGILKTKIEIEIADNYYERQLGLMNRNEMKENQGMLFIFDKLELQSFWMRNTLISLDIMFVDNQKKIVTIHKNTKILSDNSYPSSQPSVYVVEVLAGFTDRHNIQVGDKINWMGTNLGNPQ
jgi:uncharacterized membrane protein (UPF0127 family)